MNQNEKSNFFYLNRDNRWPGFQFYNVEINQDGDLQLRAVPRLVGPSPENPEQLPVPKLPAGAAIDNNGSIFLSDPNGNKIWVVNSCDEEGKPKAVPCLGDEGGLPTQFRNPSGLYIYEKRQSLLVTDTGNHRVQMFDLASMQVMEIWGEENGDQQPQPNIFNEPISLTADAEGNVYVLSRHDKLLQKINQIGQVEAQFWAKIKESGRLNNPIAVDILKMENQENIFVLDQATDSESWQVLRYNTAGMFVKGTPLENIAQPLAMVVTQSAIHIGDNSRKAVIKFDHDGREVGEAVGFNTHVAALATTGQGELIVHTGDVQNPLRLSLEAGHLTRGEFWSGPLEAENREVIWHRLKVYAAPLATGAHLQFYVTTDEPWPDEDPSIVPKADDPPETVRDKLFRERNAQPLDAIDIYIQEDKTRYLFIGAQLSGDGTTSPKTSQIKIVYNYESYMPYLPALFSNDDKSRTFLKPLLSLFESFFEKTEEDILNLLEYFDPGTAPWESLTWLAGWLAVDINEEWPEKLIRRTIAEAFNSYAWRGTAIGLRKALETYAGIRAHILEPIRYFNLWSLGEVSTLGFDTMLASAHPQGAVVGTTATLDQSHLITNDQFGQPLFEEVAHQFAVYVYRGEIRNPNKEEAVRSLIESEKPAHTDYHLCIIGPHMRIGFQSRVGIDTVIAGPPEALRLNKELGRKKSLSGKPSAKVGEGSKIGINTRAI